MSKKTGEPPKTRREPQPARTRRGLRGLRGLQGRPGISPDAVRALIDSMEQIKADAGIQFQRIAQLQAQLDMTLKALREIGEKGRSRKRR